MSYYVLERQNNDSHPLLQWDDRRSRNVARNEEVDTTSPMRLRLGAPVPRIPQMVDYHVLPDPVISDRLREVLEPMKLHMVQLVRAEIVAQGVPHSYSLLHVRNRVECLDMKRTQYVPRRSDGGIMILEKIVLDEKKLEEVPEDKRLLFCPREYETIWLAHESVKNALEAVKPIGLRFFHVRDWGDTVSFR